MKTLKLVFLVLSVGFFIFFSSCENTQEEMNGTVDFSMSLNTNDLLKSFHSDTLNPETDPSDSLYSWHLLVSIENGAGELIYNNEVIPMYMFGEDFISEKLRLRTGKYMLVKFMVVDPYGNVKFAAPLQGSPLAYLVNHPLPLIFEILPNATKRLAPEVLAIIGTNPEDFGYASFGIQIVHPILAHVMAVDDNPIYMRPSSAIPAVLSLYARDGWHYDYKLIAGVNKILVKSGYESYKLIVRNPDYPDYEYEISVQELMMSTEDNPVIFDLGKTRLYNLELQPGPDEGKDAMITDLDPVSNFGDHDFFVASFITEPILTVMRTKKSLIDFDLSALPSGARIESVFLTLAFEEMVWDSLWKGLDNYMIIDRSLVLKQIVEPWEEYKVSWENQPQTIEANQVFVPIWDELSSNVRTYDVSSIFVPYQEIAAPNYGMMFKHYNDNSFPGGWAFASSDYPIEEMRPKLTIKYSL